MTDEVQKWLNNFDFTAQDPFRIRINKTQNGLKINFLNKKYTFFLMVASNPSNMAGEISKMLPKNTPKHWKFKWELDHPTESISYCTLIREPVIQPLTSEKPFSMLAKLMDIMSSASTKPMETKTDANDFFTEFMVNSDLLKSMDPKQVNMLITTMSNAFERIKNEPHPDVLSMVTGMAYEINNSIPDATDNSKASGVSGPTGPSGVCGASGSSNIRSPEDPLYPEEAAYNISKSVDKDFEITFLKRSFGIQLILGDNNSTMIAKQGLSDIDIVKEFCNVLKHNLPVPYQLILTTQEDSKKWNLKAFSNAEGI